MARKGIILAGGSGTRLDPLTRIVCKQLLPIYDKPMIYYPLSVLMLGGIRDILIISTPKDLPMFQMLFGDGSRLGLHIEYVEQAKPDGIAQAFLLGESFLAGDGAALILGDNIFHGKLDFVRAALARTEGASICACPVKDPERYGVIEFDADGRAISIEEKPKQPRSNYAVPGFYVYDNQIVDVTRSLKPSPRGELEITDVNRAYMSRGQLYVEPLGRGVAWLDTGTPDSLMEASNYIATLEHRQGVKVACLEEIARYRGFIDDAGFAKLIDSLPRNSYRAYLEGLVF
ncbi:glucose-1-phosphate thymidylyltransferase [Terrimicrobium sacchariphilum]|uniref:Glucose-1-phosphate thymidylyltransferase n=1 Tax=Terrimicrobium sacchariphilum TaxID=690879 RepID=A0A146GDM1_TERSA|nr:glucose-1-phosphate thymidylyltransferase RfbA [Terrimicrobium sacchariphilum]GAT34747.1 glucose-1-phosphate thymidylyltransferase [Terrimicrobium sacchariphilum]